MSILEAFLQGTLQGLTEFLPVSSSGHLALFQYFTGNNGENAFLFSILLHAGTLIAVVICFWGTLMRLLRALGGLLGDLFGGRLRERARPADQRMLLFLFLSLLPLMLMLLGKDLVATLASDQDIVVEGFCFLLTGAMLLFAAKERPGRIDAERMTARDALTVGTAQLLATLPGVSRSGSTISAGLLCGFDRGYAVSYSFILGIPAVLGAIVLELKDAFTEGFTLPMPVVLVGMGSAIVFGIGSIKLVQWLVRGNRLRYFGWYTLALGSVVILLGGIDHLTGHAIQQFLLG